MTVTTHAAVHFSFSFAFTRSLYNTHYITYFMALSLYAVLTPPVVVGELLTCQSLDQGFSKSAFRGPNLNFHQCQRSGPEQLVITKRVFNKHTVACITNKNRFSEKYFTFMHLADAFIQSDLQCIQAIHLLLVCVFPGI